LHWSQENLHSDFEADPFKVDPFKVDPFKVDPFKVDPFKVEFSLIETKSLVFSLDLDFVFFLADFGPEFGF
jgi:hypothetical protein